MDEVIVDKKYMIVGGPKNMLINERARFKSLNSKCLLIRKI